MADHQLLPGILPFRVMAPFAVQGTTFKEDCGADSWTVMNGIPADVKDESCFHIYDSTRKLFQGIHTPFLNEGDINHNSL